MINRLTIDGVAYWQNGARMVYQRLESCKRPSNIDKQAVCERFCYRVYIPHSAY
jgi:hypothetical protein